MHFIRILAVLLVALAAQIGLSDPAGAFHDFYIHSEDVPDIGLTPQEGWLPEMVIIPQMLRPSQSENRVLPGLNWCYGWDINEWLGMGASTQFNQQIDSVTGSLYSTYSQSWTINYKLAEKLSLYTEWFCIVPAGADTDRTQHYFDGGFAYLVTNDIQLDIRSGVGASHASNDYFGGVGLSIRFH